MAAVLATACQGVPLAAGRRNVTAAFAEAREHGKASSGSFCLASSNGLSPLGCLPAAIYELRCQELGVVPSTQVRCSMSCYTAWYLVCLSFFSLQCVSIVS